MLKFLSRTQRLFSRFISKQNGVAAVEFALVVPLLITLYIGTVEASRALSHDRRLTSAASALGDLVAQTKGSLTAAELSDLFSVARITVAPYDASSLKQIVTHVSINANGDTNIEWSEGRNGGVGHAENASYDLPAEFIDLAQDTYVIVSEAEMNYEPITGFIFSKGITLYKEYYYVARFGDRINLEP